LTAFEEGKKLLSNDVEVLKVVRFGSSQ